MRVTAAHSPPVLSIDFLSAAGRALPPRPFQTLVSHVDVVRTVALNRDGVIAIVSLRRRGDEIRVTAARSRRVPEYQLPLRGSGGHFISAFQTLISHGDAVRSVGIDKHTVVVLRSQKRPRRRSAGFVAHAGVLIFVVKVGGFDAGSAA